jgi:hypothetical protein
MVDPENFVDTEKYINQDIFPDIGIPDGEFNRLCLPENSILILRMSMFFQTG